MVGWLFIPIGVGIFLLFGRSSQACEMVVTSQFDNNLVSVLTENIEENGVRCIAPKLKVPVTCPRIDMRDQDEFP